MDIFNDSFAALMKNYEWEAAKTDGKLMRRAADRGIIAADKVRVKGFGYTIEGAERDEFVKTDDVPTITAFEGKTNILRINDHIGGECTFALALIFTKRFAGRLRQRFDGVVFETSLSVKDEGYFLTFVRYRSYEGHFYGNETDVKALPYPFGIMLGCVKLKMTPSVDCLKVTAFDEEGNPCNVPENALPANVRGELIKLSPEESGSGKFEAMYSYACCGEQGREVMNEEIPEIKRFAENMGFEVIQPGKI
ncbi:MAG: hypothetical protein NC078_10510 [Ruminococcus sp.]|nr:hypothetical protein [Ruminococcus sp.]